MHLASAPSFTGLWPAVRARAALARGAGALQRVDTHGERLVEQGVAFWVQVAANLARKPAGQAGRAARAAAGNPFLPPEPELTVGPLGSQHTAVLNKFNVVDDHLLIITRRFEPQDSALSAADLVVLWQAVTQAPGLGFYNGGALAGASQRHKHMQLVPPTLGLPALPFQPLIDAAAPDARALAALPFRHHFRRLPPGLDARGLAALYHQALDDCDIRLSAHDRHHWPDRPYNLLLTTDWLLLVPRHQEHAAGISFNSLAYVGSLFVRDADALARLREAGPLRLLREVGLPA